MPDAEVVFPRPVQLPAGIPAGSMLLANVHLCPGCGERLVYAHCDAYTCMALACIACNIVARPDLSTWFMRDSSPEQYGHPSQRPLA